MFQLTANKGSQLFQNHFADLENYIGHWQNDAIHEAKLALLIRIVDQLEKQNNLDIDDLNIGDVGLKNLAGEAINPGTVGRQQEILAAIEAQAETAFERFIQQEPLRISCPRVQDQIQSPTYSDPRILRENDIPAEAKSIWIICKLEPVDLHENNISDRNLYSRINALKLAARLTIDGTHPESSGQVLSHLGKIIIPAELGTELRAISISNEYEASFEISFSPNSIPWLYMKPSLIKFDAPVRAPALRYSLDFKINALETLSNWQIIPKINNSQFALAIPDINIANELRFNVADPDGNIIAIDSPVISYEEGNQIIDFKPGALHFIATRGNYSIQLQLRDHLTINSNFELIVAERLRIESRFTTLRS